MVPTHPIAADRLQLVALTLSALLVTGFANESTTLRLGPKRPPHVKVGVESRPVLPQRPVLRLPADARAGCELRFGAANVGTAATLTLRVEAVSKARKAANSVALLLADTLASGAGWRDFAVPITAELAGRELKLSSAGGVARDVYWSQPLLTCPVPSETTHPNVLLITLDTLRADRLGAHGNPRGLTPRLDRLVKEGTVFTQAYSHYPNTLVSHASLFTALYPSEHGLLGGPRAKLSTAHETLAHALAQRGYATAAFTEDAFVGSDFGFDDGFDRYSDGAEAEEFIGRASDTFSGALAWLRERPASPFFVFVQTYEVHTPYTPSGEALAQLRAWQPGYAGPFADGFSALSALAYNARTLPIDASQMAWVEGLYDAEVWGLDRKLDVFLNELNAIGALESTLVVVLADHGEEFGEHGYMGHGETLHEQALHVPLIFWGKGLVPASARIDAPVGLIHVAPTIAALVGAREALPRASGRSLAHWIRAGISGRRDPVISELVASSVACPAGAKFDPLASCPYGGVVIRDDAHAYMNASATSEEHLYDRQADPGETHDLASERPELIRVYRALAAKYRQRTARTAQRVATPAPTQIDEQTERRLRSLGYVH